MRHLMPPDTEITKRYIEALSCHVNCYNIIFIKEDQTMRRSKNNAICTPEIRFVRLIFLFLSGLAL